MKILIVGDSYAASDTPYSWTHMLENFIPGANIDSRGVAGMSLYHAYRMLEENNPYGYDCVVVVVTDHQRLYVDDKTPVIAGLDKDRTFWERCDPDIASAAVAYFDHLYNDEYAKFIHMLTYQKIQQMLANHPNVLTIAAFQINDLIEIPGPLCLVDIFYREFEGYDLPYEMYMDIDRAFFSNHMSPANTRLLARYVSEMLLHGHSDITMADFRPGFPNMGEMISKLKEKRKDQPNSVWTRWLS
jgi:hypothetical protein